MQEANAALQNELLALKQAALARDKQRRATALRLLALPLRRILLARRQSALTQWVAVTSRIRQEKLFALREAQNAEIARRRYNVCFWLGLCAWLLLLALLWLLIYTGHLTAAASVRSMRGYCASGPSIRSMACIDESGCLEVTGTRSTWLCAPAEWLIDPSTSPEPPAAGPIYESGVWYAGESASACAPWGCGAAFVGT